MILTDIASIENDEHDEKFKNSKIVSSSSTPQFNKDDEMELFGQDKDLDQQFKEEVNMT